MMRRIRSDETFIDHNRVGNVGSHACFVCSICRGAERTERCGRDHCSRNRERDRRYGRTEASDTAVITESGADTLVVVFSCTGTTKGVADRIADVTDADLYEIVPAVPYTDDDRDWNDENSRCTVEQNDPDVRPEIGSDPIDLEGYEVIFVGYPIWFGEEPRIMDTFVESCDFGDATVIPFCTSGSSDIGSSGTNLAANAGSGNWLEGKRFDGDVSEDELIEWIESLGL